MAVQRFLSDVDRTRRGAGLIFIAFGGAPLAWLVWHAFGFGRVTITTLVLGALLAGLVALGLRLILHHEAVIDIDLDGRRYTVIRDGKEAGSGPLDELGPLEVSQRSRYLGVADYNPRRHVVEYVVTPAKQSDIDLYAMKTPGRARQKMEALARVWKLPCKSLGGVVRAPGHLDVPLHERLRDDPEARAAVPLRPEWGLRIQPVFRGQAIVSSHRSWAPLWETAGVAILLLAVIAGAVQTGVPSIVREAASDILAQVLLALMAIVVLVSLWQVWSGVRDTFFPGTVQVTDRGVTYRGSRMRFSQIEEITSTFAIEIVGDRRILSLPASFCPPEAVGVVVHEIQRLIIEVAPKGPALQ